MLLITLLLEVERRLRNAEQVLFARWYILVVVLLFIARVNIIYEDTQGKIVLFSIPVHECLKAFFLEKSNSPLIILL